MRRLIYGMDLPLDGHIAAAGDDTRPPRPVP